MEISTELILLIGSFLFFISMIVGKAGHKFGVPVLLLFLIVGMVFGGDGFGLKFENIQVAQAIGTISLSLILFSYISWVIGTMVGYAIGEVLPVSLQSSLSIGLYAMFAALLSPEIKKSKNILFLSIISIVVYVILFYSNIFTSGWDIILGIIISSALGVMFFSKGNREGEY